jgi:CHAT domain-containing protein
MWNVDDPATTELMTNFYQEWATSGDAYAALRKAALQIKKDRPNPYYWAPFVLYAGK